MPRQQHTLSQHIIIVDQLYNQITKQNDFEYDIKNTLDQSEHDYLIIFIKNLAMKN